MVHAVDDRGIHVLAAGRGDDDLLGTPLEVGGRLFLRREEAGAFEDHVDSQVLPRQLRGIALGDDADAVAVHHHGVALDFDLAGELAVHRVVAREVRVGLGRAEVVDGDDGEVVRFPALVMRAQDVSANAAVAVDGDANGHGNVTPGGGLG